ncbi:glycosyltransferase family 39 protein [Rhodococcus coprophilus]|uniref:Mannosyltransferase n=1 Tax=Rhodococcus coprophilus TaxID=38310 RepID=A0A2X4U042_9NOCA|nr:glycosyltransferase family 39 protein [Rhodococcus coprophilus]MBM7458650.1 mannosyltransferase [Rhodococcus coprophilus]SQI33136.1 mannosyltransferase [Rhodococcus coprophilus]
MKAWSLPLLIGGVTVLVGAAFSWVPSFWWDEAATVSAADRPFGDLLELLAEWDAVHGLHDILLHGWFAVVGTGEFAARVPGALALGVGAAAVTATAQFLAGRLAAVAAGVLFAILPRVTWAATEARSYAFAVGCAAVLSLVLILALQRRRTRWWVLYAVVAAVATMMFVYTATVVAGHLVTTWAVTRGRASRRGDRLRFVLAAAAGIVLSLPFLVLAYSQVKQVSWIPPVDETVVYTIIVGQWFPEAPWAAALCWIVAVAGGVTAAVRGVRPGERTLLWLALPGLAVPMTLLLAYSLLASNMYLDRYLSFTVPAMTLFLGWAASRVATRWWTMLVLLVAVALAAAPAYMAQRQPFGKAGGMDYSVVADKLKEMSRPGDCVAFEPSVSWQPTSPRAVADARPDAVEDLVDVGLDQTAAERVSLWSSDVPPSVLAERAATQCSRLWVIADRDRGTPFTVWHPNDVWWRFERYRFTDTETYRALADAGFSITDQEAVNRLQLVELERDHTQ